MLSSTRRGAHWALALTAALVAANTANVLIRPGGLTQWLTYEAGLFIASFVIIARGLAGKGEHAAWLLIGAGCLAWAVGDSYWFAALEGLENPPYPSLADAGWLAFYPAVFVGLVLLVRARIREFRWTLWVDGLAAGLAVGALAGAVVFGAVLDNVGGSTAAVVVNLAYPAGDTLLLALLVGALSLMGSRPGRGWTLILAGVAVFAVCDSIYLYQTAAGTWVGGTPLDLGWQVGIALLAVAAWRRSGPVERPALEGWRVLASPTVFGLLALALAISDHFFRLNLVAVILAGAALFTVIVRLALTFADNLRMMVQSRREALTDALTDLGNRRRLLADLAERLSEEGRSEPTLLVLLDLDGFKTYNDTFGHPAGDELLARFGRRLAEAVEGAGIAYRMGGDEFCVLARPGDVPAELLARRAAAALSATGEGFAICASYGLVVLPAEADRPAAALRLADGRMYAQKLTGRPSAASQSTDVLQRALEERCPGVSEHLHGVAELAEATASGLGVTGGAHSQIRLAAELHDIGKMAIPEAILAKPGPLDEDESRFVRQHTLVGERILRAAPSLEPAACLVRSSHERFDGTGYPDGLAGLDIPLGARIIAVCDAFHSMTSDRPNAGPLETGAALAELRRCAGTQFDPDVVKAFCAVVAERTPVALAS